MLWQYGEAVGGDYGIFLQLSRANIGYDGLRVHHGNGKKRVKFYNEHHVLHFEMAMNDFDVSPITNKELQKKLKDAAWAKNMQDKKLAGRISRHISLLCTHDLIKELPNQNKYLLTDQGRKITPLINVALAFFYHRFNQAFGIKTCFLFLFLVGKLLKNCLP